MPVQHTATIDFIGTGANGNCVLTLIDDLEWRDPPEHLAILQDKLNTYLRFATCGKLLRDYPDAAGKTVEIVAVFRFVPPAAGRDFLRAARERVAAAAITLSWRVFDPAAAELGARNDS